MPNTTLPQFSLTRAELAVLTRSLLGDELDLNETAQADLGVDAAALGIAEASLRERAWLLDTSDGAIAVADEVAAVLATTIVPDRVAIIRTSLPDGALPETYFSWTAERLVRNAVDAGDRHVFAVLDERVAVDEIIAASRVPQDIVGGSNGAPAALETLVAGMQALTMLIVVEQPAQPKPVARNLAWLLAGGNLWLIDGEQAANRQARRVDRAALHQAITAALQGA